MTHNGYNINKEDNMEYYLIIIPILTHYIGGLCIYGLFPFILKYGLTIFETNLGKMEIIDFSDKIGNVYEKRSTKIKVFSQNDIYFVPKYHWIYRISPYMINKCINDDGEYIIISKIPLTYLIFPLLILVEYIIEKQISLGIIGIGCIFLVISIIANNWMMKSMLIDINEFINGIELYNG
jgi:branched-subunit amino acid transport protein AzlD